MRKIFCVLLIAVWLVMPVSAENHSELIEKDFSNVRDVTKRCLECHDEEGSDFMKTSHWLWTGKSLSLNNHPNESAIGKKNLINNY